MRAPTAMTDAEVAAFVDGQRVVTCATLGPRGWPHLMPLWYAVVDGDVCALTYRRSQKLVNLARDPRATLLWEAGEAYDELRGVMLECEAELVDGYDDVVAIGLAIADRYPPAVAPEAVADTVRAQAAKRVGIRFRERRRITFDHRTL